MSEIDKDQVVAKAIIQLSAEFAAVVFHDLNDDKLKPVFDVLEAHGAKIVGDYRLCVEEFVKDFGRDPHEGYYDMMQFSFNSTAGNKENWLFVEVPENDTDNLLDELTSMKDGRVVNSVVHVLKP